MIAPVRRLMDRWRASGPYSVTVPPMDGVLSPNQVIEEAPALLTARAPDNLVSAGDRALFSTGSTLVALLTDGLSAKVEDVEQFDRDITSLAVAPDGAIAVALGGGRIALRGGKHHGTVLSRFHDRPLLCPTALLFADADTLIVALGSQHNAPEDWQRDLVERGVTGSVWRCNLETGDAGCLADRLAYPAGLLQRRDGSLIVAESWRNRLVEIRPGRKPGIALPDITGFPSRLAPKADGTGSWLSVFAPRSQLIEFVLRESDYRTSMMRELDPQFWVAPSLSASQSYLEPMQFGALKQLGVLKAWAPTRSYGLVVGLDNDYEPQISFHSRADGRRHGITSCIEMRDRLLATSKGGDVIVSIPLSAASAG
jgi:hypothetical protein